MFTTLKNLSVAVNYKLKYLVEDHVGMFMIFHRCFLGHLYNSSDEKFVSNHLAINHTRLDLQLTPQNNTCRELTHCCLTSKSTVTGILPLIVTRLVAFDYPEVRLGPHNKGYIKGEGGCLSEILYRNIDNKMLCKPTINLVINLINQEFPESWSGL